MSAMEEPMDVDFSFLEEGVDEVDTTRNILKDTENSSINDSNHVKFYFIFKFIHLTSIKCQRKF